MQNRPLPCFFAVLGDLLTTILIARRIEQSGVSCRDSVNYLFAVPRLYRQQKGQTVGRSDGNVSVPWPDDDAVTDGGAGGKTISGTIFVVIRGAERGWRSVLPRKPQRKQGETASIVNNDA